MLANRLTTTELVLWQDLTEYFEERDISVRVLCARAPDVLGTDLEVQERPGLRQRWRCDWELRQMSWKPEERPRLLHVLDPEVADAGLAIAEHLKIPYILTVDDFLPPGSRLRLSRRWFRGILAGGEDLARDLLRSTALPAAWVEVLPPGIALPELEQAMASSRSREGIVVVGTHPDDLAGMRDFFEASSLLLNRGFDAEFVVAGPVDEEPQLRRMCEAKKLTDRTSFVDPWTVGEAFWSVFNVYCRLSRSPAAGPEIGEAMAQALPVVVSDVPGLRSWVQPGYNGLTVPSGDNEALAATLETLLANPSKARALGENARAWVAENCGLERRAALLTSTYERVLMGETPEPVPGGIKGAEGG